MLNTKPLVSAIVVNLNRKDDLRECLNSLLAQDYDNVEIIVVDNGSTDGSPEMVALEYPQVKLIRLDRNLGCPGGRNVGILNAKGEILFFLDNDATAEPDVISKIVSRMSIDEKLGAVVPQIINCSSDRNIIHAKDIKSQDKMERYVSVTKGSSAISREVFQVIGLYPNDYMYGGEETDLSLRMLENGYRILELPSAVIYHKESTVHRNRRWEYKNRFNNDLRTLWRYAPNLFLLVMGTAKKCIRYFVEAVRRGFLPEFISSIIDFPLKFVYVIRHERTAISLRTYALVHYLNKKDVSDWNEILFNIFNKDYDLRSYLKEQILSIWHKNPK